MRPFEADGWHCPFCEWAPERTHGCIDLTSDDASRVEGFDADFFARLAEAEEGHFWFEYRSRLLRWAVNKFFPAGDSFLEIGCGNGFILSAIKREHPGLRVYGSDIFYEGILNARSRVPEADFFRMNALRIPFVHEFDIIGAFDVLEHIEADTEALAQMYKATKRRGGIILTVPQHPFLWSRQDEIGHHKRRYRRAELVRKVTTAGFEVVMVTSFITVLFPMMLVSRLLGRLTNDDRCEGGRELRLPSPVNGMFGRICDAEMVFIRKGLSLPLGGSLLCVGVKK